MTEFVTHSLKKKKLSLTLATCQENTVNVRSCLHSFLRKKSEAELKSTGAVKLLADHLRVAVLF